MKPVDVAPLLKVEDLRVAYGGAQALFGVSLEVARGSAVAVLGANGAGKSTLARALSGVVKPSGGSILFDGRDITKLGAHRIARLGLAHVPEGRGIFRGLTVEDNLRVSLRYATSKPKRAEAIGHAFELFPVLGERRRQTAGTLSGGEQQMLALARVLAVSPKLALADEMSLGLAPLLVDSIFDALERVREAGVTLVIIEQFVERALRFADVAVILRRGRVAWSGSAAEAGNAVLEEYLGEPVGGVQEGVQEGGSSAPPQGSVLP